MINSGEMCRSYSDLNFGVTFLEHTVYLTFGEREGDFGAECGERLHHDIFGYRTEQRKHRIISCYSQIVLNVFLTRIIKSGAIRSRTTRRDQSPYVSQAGHSGSDPARAGK